MKSLKLALQVSMVWVALIIAQVIANILIPVRLPAAPDVLPWFLFSTILVAAVLVFLAVRSDWRGWRLAAALSAIPLVLSISNNLEGKIFLTSFQISWAWVVGTPFIIAALTFPVWLLINGKPRKGSEVNYRPFHSRSTGQWIWRFAVSSLAYACLYFLAGLIVIQYVGDFYATQTLPSTSLIFALQLFVRGPAYVVICLLLVRMLGLSRRTGALAVGLVFTTINGIAPLLIPNGVFPDYVRWAHLYEITGSNLVFCAVVAWLWGEAEPDSKVESQLPASV
jgi:hypothetical protein